MSTATKPSVPPQSPRHPHSHLGPGFRHGRYRYKTAPTDLYFPTEEKVPEEPRHLVNRTALWQSACDALADRAIVGSDQFLYWDPTNPNRRLAPDLLIKLGGPGVPPPAWKIWINGYPDVAAEIISPSDAPDGPWQVKLSR